MVCSVDDYELTLKELKSQRLQLVLQMKVLNAAIVDFESTIANLRDDGVVDGVR